MKPLPKLTKQLEPHLPEEQLYCLLDDPNSGSAATRLHLDDCSACQSELATLRASFANFRAAATGYAALRMPQLASRAAVADAKPSWIGTARIWRPIWAVSCAGAVAVLGISLSLVHQHPVTPAVKAPVVTADTAQPEESDEALLDGIERDLSTSVPPSLEPLEVSASTGTKTVTTN